MSHGVVAFEVPRGGEGGALPVRIGSGASCPLRLWMPCACVFLWFAFGVQTFVSNGCSGLSVTAKQPQQLTQFASDTFWIPNIPKLTDFWNFWNYEISLGVHLNIQQLQTISKFSQFRNFRNFEWSRGGSCTARLEIRQF